MVSEVVLKRFWIKVDRKNDGECWNWKKPNCYGYGQFAFNKRVYAAHRFSWIIHFGIIPNGMYICHHCDNKACVNPNHLFLGTQNDNMQDMVKKNRQAFQKGSNNGNCKLTEMIVIGIRHRYKTQKCWGHCAKLRQQLADEFSVSTSTIRKIISREVWSHIK